jgi:hypothetical protein
MGAREQIEKQLAKKRAERAELQRDFEKRLNLADGHIEGLEAALKALPKDGVIPGGEVALRDGGGAALARDFLQTLGRPAHIAEIVVGIGKDSTHRNKVSLASVMSSYARQGKVFTKVPGKPNTFGLIGAEEQRPTLRPMSLTEPTSEGGEEAEFEAFGGPEEEESIEEML